MTVSRSKEVKGRYEKVAEVKVRGDISFRLGKACVYL